MERIICLAVGYLFGLLQTGYLYGRLNGIDIRQYGSGNSGTTNALRVLGKKAGLVVFAGDFLKTLIPCLADPLFVPGSHEFRLSVYALHRPWRDFGTQFPLLSPF